MLRPRSRRVSPSTMDRRIRNAIFFGTLLSLTMVQMSLWTTWNAVSIALHLDISLPSILAPYASRTETVKPSNTDETTTSLPPFRMLLGIFTYDKKPNGKLQRALIRRTYLSLPASLERFNITTISLRHSRICSLQDYVDKTIEQPEQCQLLYTFVIGGNPDPNAPLEYLAPESPHRSLTINVSNPERDVVYLNIKENMDHGKTNTWMHYASTYIPPEINIVAKVDTDSLVFPNVIAQEIEAALTTPDSLIYGGTLINNDRGSTYMQGGFYFLSRTLARVISINRQDRWEVIQGYWKKYRFQRPEDLETGEFVKASHQPNVTWLDIPEDKAWVHRKELKEETGFLIKWEKYLMYLIVEDRLRKMEQQYGECPDASAQEIRPFLDTVTSDEGKVLFSDMLGHKLSYCRNITKSHG